MLSAGLPALVGDEQGSGRLILCDWQIQRRAAGDAEFPACPRPPLIGICIQSPAGGELPPFADNKFADSGGDQCCCFCCSPPPPPTYLHRTAGGFWVLLYRVVGGFGLMDGFAKEEGKTAQAAAPAWIGSSSSCNRHPVVLLTRRMEHLSGGKLPQLGAKPQCFPVGSPSTAVYHSGQTVSPPPPFLLLSFYGY